MAFGDLKFRQKPQSEKRHECPFHFEETYQICQPQNA